MPCFFFSPACAWCGLFLLSSWTKAVRTYRTQAPFIGGNNNKSVLKKWRDGGYAVADAFSRWNPSWGPCSSTCGKGEQELLQLSCVNLMGAEVDEEACANSKMPMPDMVQPCEETKGCAWRCQQPRDRCGWGAAECIEESSSTSVSSKLCTAASHLPDGDTFVRISLCMNAKGCTDADFPKTVRAVTLNLPDKHAQEYERSIFQLLAEAYNDEDLLVISTQELSQKAFTKYMKKSLMPVDGKHPLVLVATCLNRVSPGTALYVKEPMRRMLAPMRNDCEEIAGSSSLAKNLGIGGNVKGTMIMVVRSLIGPIIVGSSHLHRGGVSSATRVREFKAAGAKIQGLWRSEPVKGWKPWVIWGGDFNTRTQVHSFSGLSAGITHPPFDLTDIADEFAGIAYDPIESLNNFHVTFMDDLGDGRSIDQVLHEVFDGNVTQVTGIRDICPTYYKAPEPGSAKSTWLGGEKTWRPSWSCQESPNKPIEYYILPTMEQMQGDSSRAPSYTERILTGGLRCRKVEKWTQKKDHDALHAACAFS